MQAMQNIFSPRRNKIVLLMASDVGGYLGTIGQKHCVPFSQMRSALEQFEELLHCVRQNASQDIPPTQVGMAILWHCIKNSEEHVQL